MHQRGGLRQPAVPESKCTATTAPHSIAAGRSNTCARKPDGTLWCWGINDKGQLGNGTTGRDNAVPAKVQVLNTSVAEVAEVAAGYDHTCARKIDGTLWCWGSNSYGQCSDAFSFQVDVHNVPFQAMGLVGAETLDAGGDHACASTTAKEFYCWGRDDYGQLGAAIAGSPNKPTKVPEGLPVERAISVAAGGLHTCAAFEGGDVYCWGRNHFGQVGDGTVVTPRTLPLKVNLPMMAEQVVAGDYFSCARLIDGRCGAGVTTATAARHQWLQ